MPTPTTFDGKILVASRIVDYLSSGLYESPAACLKELVNNSYDADATRVDVFVKPDADRIIIQDDGSGMNKDDFLRHFTTISESYKRLDSEFTEGGRAKIGKIGIGFIAANEICDVMELVSTKTGSDQLLEVEIRFDLMRQDPALRKLEGTKLAKGDYTGRVTTANREEHFTTVFLKRIRGEAKSILAGAGKNTYTSGERSLYGLSLDSIFKRLSDPSLKSWSEFDEYSQNILHVGLNVPVRYHSKWLPASQKPANLLVTKEADEANFSLYVDGSEVRKPVVLHPAEGKTLVSRFRYEGSSVSAHGYFYAQHGAVRPQELQGLLLRIRNAAVGEYDHSFLGFSSTIGPLLQRWISGEIYADDRLEEAMNIDRRTLRVAHPAYVELQSAVHQHLAMLVGEVRKKIYGVGSQARKVKKAEEIEEQIQSVVHDVRPTLSKSAALLSREWKGAAESVEGQSRLLRRYSVAELYEVVVDVAREVLSPGQMEKFLKRLTERLRK